MASYSDPPDLTFDNGVTLVGGAPFESADLSHARRIAPHVVAADGGVDALIRRDVAAEAVIGDMDSICGPVPDGTEILRIDEQDSTDFDKCLARVTAPFFIGVGFLGERLDHTLAVLHGMMVHRGGPVILIGEADIAFAAPREWAMEMAAGERISFFPVMPCRGVSSTGLRWPIDGLAMAVGRQIGTSNQAIGGGVSVAFDAPGIVTILPKRHLDAVVQSLV